MASQQAIALYRDLLKQINKLPRNSRQYYRQNLKGGFINHSEEADPERLQQLFLGARKDAEFILTKYVRGGQEGSKPAKEVHQCELQGPCSTYSMQTRQRNVQPVINGQAAAPYTNGKAAHVEEENSTSKPVVLGALTSIASLVLYLTSSSYIILLNKRLMVDDGFKFPLALTGLAQLAGAVAGWTSSRLGFVKLGPAPTPHFLATRLLPIVLSSAGALYFGNVAYLSLSVAFIQILKVLTPAVTLAICATFKLERLTGPLLVSILMITLGTGVATAVEVGVVGFAWPGFFSFLFSTLMEAVRVVYIQLLLGKLSYSSMEVLVYLGAPTGLVLLAASAIWEREGLLASGLALMAHKPLHYLSAIFMGFLVNLSTAFAIKVTGSLTFKVVGCVKNTLLVWVGILMGDVVTRDQLLGYTVSVVGFALYTHVKYREGLKKIS